MSTKQAERTKAADQIMRLLTLLAPTLAGSSATVRPQDQGLYGDHTFCYRTGSQGTALCPVEALVNRFDVCLSAAAGYSGCPGT